MQLSINNGTLLYILIKIKTNKHVEKRGYPY